MYGYKRAEFIQTFHTRAEQYEQTPTISTQGAIRITKNMFKWLQHLFDNLPLRALPFLYMDSNSKFGFNSAGNIVDSKCLGGCNKGRENKIGTLIRLFLEKNGMILPHTTSEQPPTFYSTNSDAASHIDHIAVPLSVWEHPDLDMKAHVWLRSGRKLQLIRHTNLAYHR